MACSVKKIDECASVVSNKKVAPGFYKMRVAAPKSGKLFKPGQFFQLQVNINSAVPLLRRPFAPSEADEKGFAFTYAVVGEGTEQMSRLNKGAEVGVLAPLGNGYKLPKKGSRVILVGGGCGGPSLRLVGERLVERGCEVFSVIGSQTKCTLLEQTAFKKISSMMAVSTDDGSAGVHGHAVAATKILIDEIGIKPKPEILACGPHPMLKGLATLAEELKLKCQVSLEERMACGFGACMGCVVAVKADNADGFVYKRVCHDGPIFNSGELLW